MKLRHNLVMETFYRPDLDKEKAIAIARERITPEGIKKKGYKAKVDLFGDQLKISGKGFDINLYFENTSVTGNLKLSLILRPAQGKIKKEIQSVMDSLFG